MARWFGLFAMVGVLAFASVLSARKAEGEEDVVRGRKGMVVAVSPPGAEVGAAILKSGGNAVDAAIATALAMAVTYPQAGNIGGGGFMLVYPPKGEPTVIDYREIAPKAAHAKTFTKDDTWYSHRAVGVPGTIRGLALAHQKFGSKPWKELLAPAINLAEKGFKVDRQLAESLNWFIASSAASKEAVRVLSPDGKSSWMPGDLLVQKDLAATLRRIAEEGPDAFYKGVIADQIAAEMKEGKGLIVKTDLEGYAAKARPAIHTTFRGHDVYGAPPVSSGGVTLALMLNMLEPMNLRARGRWSPETLHLLIETMRRAYAMRARYLGDSDFVEVPIAKLTSKEYAAELAKTIDPKHATKSEDVARDIPLSPESENTTHFSVIDGSGMAVSNTYTLERSYGSGIMVRGAGFLLNNEMGDFNWFPGVTTRSGTIGTEPNQIAPGKRMLSSQSPTIVVKDGKVRIVTGSPGSRTIINTSLQIVLNVVEFDMNPREAVDAPRLHHAWFPDVARFEGTYQYPEVVKTLEALGHTIQSTRQGDAHTIIVDPKTGEFIGVPDRRINGKAAGF
jgi:gamma-glutamyltranspeptidase/glutathione hydrolase